MSTDSARLDPDHRTASAHLLRRRPLWLAVHNAPEHRECWPHSVAQVGPVTQAMAAELAALIGDEHPHVRWLRGE